ncbi:MAG: cytochrome c [Myxococcota bacterium]
MTYGLRALAFAALYALVGCNGDGKDPTDTGAEPAGDTAQDATTDVGGSEDAVSYEDVAPILADHCVACHGDPTANGAPFALLAYDDVASRADRIVARAVDGDPRPMPPVELVLSAAEAQTLLDWVEAGTPE